MSWFDDNAFDGYWPDEKSEPLTFRDVKWMQKDGKFIALSEMTDRHLYFAFGKCYDQEMQELMLREMTIRLFERRLFE